jgi:hypothetical protein
MLQSFSYEKLDRGNGVIVFSLNGDLDEQAKLPKPQDYAGFKKVIFDFMGLRYMGSAGIKSWIFLMEDIRQSGKNVSIDLINCPKPIIDCINSIEDFIPANANVISFKLPHFCQNCDKSFAVLESADRVRPLLERILTNSIELESHNCPECHKVAELDLVPEHYFRFLRRSS